MTTKLQHQLARIPPSDIHEVCPPDMKRPPKNEDDVVDADTPEEKGNDDSHDGDICVGNKDAPKPGELSGAARGDMCL